jgi:hypothetical protein
MLTDAAICPRYLKSLIYKAAQIGWSFCRDMWLVRYSRGLSWCTRGDANFKRRARMPIGVVPVVERAQDPVSAAYAWQNFQVAFVRFLSGLAPARFIGRRIFPLSMAARISMSSRRIGAAHF